MDWQIIGTDVVGDSLAPTTYQAVATYTGQRSSKVATGYVATADYRGTVYRSGVESITYKVKYLGVDASASAENTSEEAGELLSVPALREMDPSTKEAVLSTFSVLSKIMGVIAIVAVLILAVLLFRSRKEIRQLQEPENIDNDYDEEMEEEIE